MSFTPAEIVTIFGFLATTSASKRASMSPDVSPWMPTPSQSGTMPFAASPFTTRFT